MTTEKKPRKLESEDQKEGEDTPISAPNKNPMEEMIERLVNSSVKTSVEAMAAVFAGLMSRQDPRAEARRKLNERKRCNICQQHILGCKGEHELMVVYPKTRGRGKWFQGCLLNGVTYLSNNGSHKIPVPKENDFARVIDEWERNEEELSISRKGGFDSGSIGPAGAANFRPADGAGWR